MPGKNKKENSVKKGRPASPSSDIFSNFPAVVCELSPDGLTLYVNESVFSFTGYKPEELIGKNWWDVLCGNENRREISKLYDQIRLKDVSDYELDLKTKKGDLVAINWSSRNVYSRGKNLERVVGICLEITGRRYAEEALRESLERYRLLFENQGEGFGTVDESEFFTFCNPAAERIFGVKEGGLVGRSLREFTSKDDFEVIKQQTAKRKMGQTSSYDLELRLPDGNKRSILVTSTPRYNAIGDYSGAYGVFRDITDRKRAEEALRLERDRVKKYIDMARTMLVVINANKEIELINKMGCSVLGYDESEIIGKNWFENFVPERIRKEVLDVFDRLMRGEIKPEDEYENPVLTKSGQERIISWRNSVLYSENRKISGTLSSGEDVTDKK